MRIKILVLSCAMLLPLNSMAMDEASALRMAKKHNCLACHSLDEKMVGPAWRDVGRKYADNPAIRDDLVERVRRGTVGEWGNIPMPPNPTVKKRDIETLVDFVLSLK